MSNTKAYTQMIGPRNRDGGKFSSDEAGSTLGDDIGLINQTSPAWVLTFVRWEYRDTLRTPTATPTAVREPLIVESDCISVTTTFNKSTLTHNMSAMLLQTDTNYAAAIHPGDFVFVNILNWEEDASDVANRAAKQLPINEQDDGFKGVYKVQSVRKVVRVDPQSGTRTVGVKIDGFAFTEFNNTIYFNPNLILPKLQGNFAFYLSDIAKTWANNNSLLGTPYLQEIIVLLIQLMIGTGINPDSQLVNGNVVSPNVQFLIPSLVGNLLGLQGSENNISNTNGQTSTQAINTPIAARDIYRYIFGVQKYSSGAGQNLQDGMNPSNLNSKQKYPNTYFTDINCGGNSVLKPEYWNQVTLWSIMNQYTNAPLNELFSTLRVDKNSGRVLPTIVFRQIPFTSEDFQKQIVAPANASTFGILPNAAVNIPITPFLTLPRWKVGAESVFSVDLGTDEAARVNFVQYYAKSTFDRSGIDTSNETANGNYVYDKNDVSRSGLRPVVIQNQFEDLVSSTALFAKQWALVYGDALIGGHLKLNGTIECVGIEEPIAVGDNFEFDNTVFHIEQVVHTGSISPGNGIKTFRTVLSLSHGVNVESNADGTVYSEMNYPNAILERELDYKNEQILPGVSDSQDTRNRPKTVDGPPLKDVGFPQPNLKPNKNGGGGK